MDRGDNMIILYINKKTGVNELFQLAELLIGQSGGDGDAIIMCPEYIEYADKYDDFRKNFKYYGEKCALGYNWIRENLNEHNHILFSDQSNEGLSFMPLKHTTLTADFIVILE